MENSYDTYDVSECKYLEKFDNQYVYLGSCRFSIYRVKKETTNKNPWFRKIKRWIWLFL
jgi:uncharacterized membrane protein